MKKITSLLVLIFCFWATAQVYAQFEPSTSAEGPWYKIVVKGSDAVRGGRAMMAKADEVTGQQRVYGVYNADLMSMEDVDRIFWRVEDVGDGTYKVINKSTETALSVWHWVERTKDIMTVTAEPTTTWDIIPIDDGTSGLYFFRAFTPLTETSPWAHQGNSGWEFNVIMETDTWGNSLDSQFEFIPYDPNEYDPDEFLLKVNPEVIDFGMQIAGAGDLETVKIATITGTPDANNPIDYSIETISGPAEAFYVINEGNFETESGGELVVHLEVTEPGKYEALINVTRGDLTKSITLKATVVPKIPIKTSPAIANSDQDVWYSIRLNQRTGYYLKDMGADEKVEVYPGIDQEDPSQLWKFVPVAENDTTFKIVSQLGNVLDNLIVDETDPVTGNPITPNYFYTTTDSDDSFAFRVQNATDYALQWCEYKVEAVDPETGEIIMQPALTYVSKIAKNDYFDHWNPAAETALRFIELGSPDYVKTNLPTFSNGDTEDEFYYIRFYRKVAAGDTLRAVNSTAIGELIMQDTIVDPADPYFWWKFVGTWDNFKIVNVDGGEIGQVIDADLSTFLEEPGLGASYKMWGFDATGDFYLECLTDRIPGRRFINDRAGSIGGWSMPDAGNRLFFTPKDEIMWTVGIEYPEMIVDAEDPVASSVYYTIQGVQLGNVKPAAPGFYIRKNIHESGKVSAETIYVVK